MSVEMVTIRIPKELCSALWQLAQFAGDAESMQASYAIAYLFCSAVEKGEITLDHPSLNIFKPYDEVTDQGGWNFNNAAEFHQLLIDALK